LAGIRRCAEYRQHLGHDTVDRRSKYRELLRARRIHGIRARLSKIGLRGFGVLAR
jgi:hypothetical protein